jgi:hypothetical protein
LDLCSGKFEGQTSGSSFKKVALAHSLAGWTGDNVPVVKAVFAAQPDLASLRDLALHFNVDKLAALVDPEALPETTPRSDRRRETKELRRGFAAESLSG